MSESVLSKLKTAASKKRLRAEDFFFDFDPLRSGFITKSQFQRILSQRFGATGSESEYQVLSEEFETKKNGLTNYRAFLDQLAKAEDYSAGATAFSSQLEQQFQSLIARLKRAYTMSGVDIKACYEKFDPHNCGRVTKSQFLRAFPGPSSISEAEKEILAQRYRNSSGDVDYLKFYFDVDDSSHHPVSPRPWIRTAQGATAPDSLEATTEYSAVVSAVLDKLKATYFRCRVRPIDFFADHDPLRSGIVTENQFTCGLSLSCPPRDSPQLTRDEVNAVIQAFKQSHGVNYRKFCSVVDSAFQTGFEVNLERLPTGQPRTINRSDVTLNAYPAYIDDDEEQLIRNSISAIRERVRTTGANLYTLFQDFNFIYGNTQTATRSQFDRLLSTIGVVLDSRAVSALVSKYKSTRPNEIDYRAFVAAVDNCLPVGAVSFHFSKFIPVTYLDKTEQLFFSTLPLAQTRTTKLQGLKDAQEQSVSADENIQLIVKKIQRATLRNRVRIGEYFSDHDKLRSGFVTRPKFEAVLNRLGYHLSKSELLALETFYVGAADRSLVAWKDFERDVDSVFTDQDLTSSPLKTVPKLEETFSQLQSEITPSAEDRGFSGDQLHHLDGLLYFIGQQVEKKGIEMQFVFRDFDKHNNGHVSEEQFKRTLTIGQLSLSKEDVCRATLLVHVSNINQAELLALYFLEAKGVNYRQFLSRVAPQSPLEDLYVSTRRTRAIADEILQDETVSAKPKLEFEEVMERVAIQSVRERLRIIEYLQDYDRLRSGRVNANCFSRGLQECNLRLSDDEIATIAQYFASPKVSGYVDYVAFSDYVDAAFTTKNLEKTPTLTPVPFVPPPRLDLASRSRTAAGVPSVDNKVIAQLATLVRTERILLKSIFVDYDKHRFGTVTKAQFRRVLKEAGLDRGLPEPVVQAIINSYSAPVGGRDDVYYSKFCGDLDNLAAQQHAALV